MTRGFKSVGLSTKTWMQTYDFTSTCSASSRCAMTRRGGRGRLLEALVRRRVGLTRCLRSSAVDVKGIDGPTDPG